MSTVFHCLRSALALRPTPIVAAQDTCPAASLWTGGIAVMRGLVAAGVRPSDRVAVQLPNGPGFVQAMLGCLRLGAEFCPIQFESIPEEASARARSQGAVQFIASLGELEALMSQELEEPGGTTGTRTDGLIHLCGNQGEPDRILDPAEIARLVSEFPFPVALLPEACVVSLHDWATPAGMVELLASLGAGAIIEVSGKLDNPTEGLRSALERHGSATVFANSTQIRALQEGLEEREFERLQVIPLEHEAQTLNLRPLAA